MRKRRTTNITASIRQRLLNLARERNEEFQLVLVRYALERLLYRISQSRHKDQFILKGAMLFQLWTGQPHRSTRDLDLLGKGDDDEPSRYAKIFREACVPADEEDGLVFDAQHVQAEVIRENQKYAGVRVHALAMLGRARIPLQIDIGFGDAVTPKPIEIAFPSLLNLPQPRILAYPKETVVAEKFEAMVLLGISNSRMKDFYDLWVLASSFAFEGGVLSKAIRATFKRRGTTLPIDPPVALTADFSGNASKQAQWQAFLRRGKFVRETPSLEKIVTALRGFLWPVAQAIHGRVQFNRVWEGGGPWIESEEAIKRKN